MRGHHVCVESFESVGCIVNTEREKMAWKHKMKARVIWNSVVGGKNVQSCYAPSLDSSALLNPSAEHGPRQSGNLRLETLVYI